MCTTTNNTFWFPSVIRLRFHFWNHFWTLPSMPVLRRSDNVIFIQSASFLWFWFSSMTNLFPSTFLGSRVHLGHCAAKAGFALFANLCSLSHKFCHSVCHFVSIRTERAVSTLIQGRSRRGRLNHQTNKLPLEEAKPLAVCLVISLPAFVLF